MVMSFLENRERVERQIETYLKPKEYNAVVQLVNMSKKICIFFGIISW